MKYLHVGEVYGNCQFVIHEDDFQFYIDELVKELGEDWRHELSSTDEAGNPEYIAVEELDREEWEHVLKIGYCSDCGIVLERNEDGALYCPECLNAYL